MNYVNSYWFKQNKEKQRFELECRQCHSTHFFVGVPFKKCLKLAVEFGWGVIFNQDGSISIVCPKCYKEKND